MKKAWNFLFAVLFSAAFCGAAWAAQPTPVAKKTAKAALHSKGTKKMPSPKAGHKAGNKSSVIPLGKAPVQAAPTPQPPKPWWRFW